MTLQSGYIHPPNEGNIKVKTFTDAAGRQMRGVVPVDRNGNLTSGGVGFDAFGRQRVSQPFALLDATHHYGQRHELFNSIAVSGATQTDSMVDSSLTLAVTSTVGSKLTNRSRRLYYHAGRSHLFMMTGVMGATATGIVKRIGYFDDDDGVYFKNTGGAMSIVLRSSVSGAVLETEIPQANWNGDKLDGTGSSGITLDPTKALIFMGDMQWLGVGRVRVGFDFGGNQVVAHEFQHANLSTQVYMQTANLPCCYEIENISATVGDSMSQICASVFTEGQLTISGVQRGASNDVTGVTVSSSVVTPVLSIRPAALFKGRTNKAMAIPIELEILITGTKDAHYEVYEDATLTGAVWTPHSDPTSMMEIDTSATALTGGRVRGEGYAASRGKGILTGVSEQTYAMQIDGAGVPDALTIAAQGISASTKVFASIIWREQY